MFASTFYIIAILAAAASAGTIKTRQNFLDGLQLGDLGSIGCNVARLRIVGALGDTEDSVAEIEDPDTAEAAAAGLSQAQGGIQQIAQAIIAGEAPPQEGRDEVEAGLTAAGEALASGDSEDPAVVDAQEALDESIAAGQDVVAKC